MYRQTRIPGGRESAWAGLPPHLKDWVRAEAARYDVSMSFVLSTAISYISGMRIEQDYRDVPRRTRRRRAQTKVAR